MYLEQEVGTADYRLSFWLIPDKLQLIDRVK